MLLREAAAGKEMAFTELFHRYKYKLYGYIFALTRSKEMAEDVVQDVFLKLWQKRETMAELNEFAPYLFRMAQNRAINGFQRMATEARALAALRQTTRTNAMDIEDQLVAKDLEQRLQDAVQKLPPQQQQVYRLSREDGLKHEEIAERLKIAPGTVKNHMIAALRTLRAQMQPQSSVAALSVFLFIAATFVE
jgi:RNA polymerase sigma-70 factor (family 1)